MTLLTLLACTSSPHLPDPREPIRLSLRDRGPDTPQPAEPSLDADTDGVRLRYGGSQLRVRTTAWGRGENTTPLTASPSATGARTELHAPGLTEWWEQADQGWEQGWTVQARPYGAGELTLQVHVVTPVRVTADHVDLGLGPTAWRVSGLHATDATGSALPARFVTAPGGFAVVVDDRHATYPLNIDPVYSTPNAELNTGWSGESWTFVDGAGDVNGDGYDDVLVTSSLETEVFLSGPDGASTTPSAIIAAGLSVAGAGDLNGDGYGDIVIGDYQRGDHGIVEIYYGSADGTSPSAGTLLWGDQTNDMFGYSVDGAGDVNADGYDDIVIAAPVQPRRTLVYFGSVDGITDVRNSVSGVGSLVAGAGDLNGDGYGDIASSEGPTWVCYGSADAVTAVDICSWTQLSGLRTSVPPSAGDVNGDGFDDLVIGDPNEGEDFEGGIAVYFGSAGVMADPPGLVIAGEPWTALGRAFASGGDLDGDGYDELLVKLDNRREQTGRVAIYAGMASGMSCEHAWAIDGAYEQWTFGDSVASAGDVNADGLDDIIVGAYGGDANPEAVVYLGRPSTDADATGICDTAPFDTDTGPPADDSRADSKSGCGGCASAGQPHPGALIALYALILARRRARGLLP